MFNNCIKYKKKIIQLCLIIVYNIQKDYTIMFNNCIKYAKRLYN